MCEKKTYGSLVSILSRSGTGWNKNTTESEDGMVSAINNLAEIIKSTMSDLVKQLGTDEKIDALLDNACDALESMT